MEEREDGSNVNGWHWQEQNKLPWSRQRIDELTKGLNANLDASLGKAEITGIKDLTGEVKRAQYQYVCIYVYIYIYCVFL